MDCENKYILMTKTGDAWQIEEGHSIEEFNKLYSGAYDEGTLWDFSEEDVKSGAVEAQPNMVYWKIMINDEPRIFETDRFEEWDMSDCRIEESCKLEEGTSNFGSLDNFPLLAFYTYDEILYNMKNSLDYPDTDDFESEDGDIDWDAYDDAVETFEQDYFDNLDASYLDEDEVERLENRLADFNAETQSIADERWDYDYSDEDADDLALLSEIKVHIEPGYYEAAYIDVDNEKNFEYMKPENKEKYIKRFEDLFAELKKEFGLYEYAVAYKFSNGETGYKKVECLNESAKGPYEIEYWVDEEARDQGLGDIAIETFDDLEDAKEFADKLFGEVASVEVLDTDGNVVYGRYPEDESLKEEKVCEAPENPGARVTYLLDGEEIIKEQGPVALVKSGSKYIVKYAPGYYVNEIKADNDEEAIKKFLGLEESLKIDEKKAKKLKYHFTGDPAKDAAFFNHCMGSDYGEVSTSVSLGERLLDESQDDYYVVSDGVNPRHSYVFDEKGRDLAINMVKAYKGDGYWEVLHYVKGNPVVIYNTKDGEVEEK